MITPIGIDVSKDTLDVCVLLKDAKPKYRKFRNSEGGFKDLVNWANALAPEFPKHFGLESTGCYGFGLAMYLSDNSHTVSVENAKRIKHFCIAANLKIKTDKADSFGISRYVEVMKPREWVLKDIHHRELVMLRTRLRQLAKTRLAEFSRLEDKYLSEFVRNQIQDHIDYLDKLTCETEQQVRTLMVKCESARVVYHAVTGLMGVGPEVGLLLATLDIEGFDAPQSVPTFFGLNPRLHQSGKFCGKTKISKQGDASARATLMSAANSACRSNPVFKEFYQRLVANGLKHKQAVAAVARKMLMVAWAIARNALRGLPVTYPGGEYRRAENYIYCPKC
jgi:transposase